MITKNKIIFGMFLLFGILLISFGSATYTRSNIQYTQPSSGFSAGGYWQPDRSMCEAGQDFIIQIVPFGCTPAIVRSDLLEEQNVPVFCQLGATKINPLIEVEAIESLSFSGRYPKEVSGVGFHPARAALGVSGDLNSPILNNIGYAVIVLKKQENASAMPDFVQGNLTAKIKYDIKNALGIGKATFYLPEMSDDDWEKKHSQYNFWNGRFYLRAEGIDSEGATILIYDDTRRLSTVSLEKGKTSDMIYLPGFDCLAGLKLRLDGLEAPDTRAKLDINGEIVEVAEDEKFLENRCWVTDIDKKGLVQKVTIKCKEDESSGFFGSKSFDLMVKPKVNLTICDEDEKTNCITKDYTLGDVLYKDEEVKEGSRRNVFLGYIGEKKDGGVFIISAITQHHTSEDFLNSIDMELVEKFAKIEENLLKDKTFIDGLKYEFAAFGAIVNAIVRGSDFSGPIMLGSKGVVKFPVGELMEGFKKVKKLVTFKKDWKALTYTKKSIKFNGFAGAQDVKLKEDTKENYQNAIKDYDKIINSFSNEKYVDGFDEITYGEEALYQKIKLAYDIGQRKTVVDLCKEFKNKYPKSKIPLKTQCKDTYKLSSSEISTRDVLVNGVKRISFEGIYEPKFDDYGAVIRVTGTEDRELDRTYELEKNDRVILSNEEWFELREVNDNYISIYANVKKSGIKEGIIGIKQENYKIKLSGYQNLGENNQYEIRLTKINLKKSAKVSVIPNINNVGTEANFSFKIGIEKRAIQLSPEKTLEKIKSLNETIKKWEEKSEQLGKVVKGLKTACLSVGAYLTIKNLFTNAGGKAIARQEVMRGEGGWYDKCADGVNGKGELKDEGYTSIDQCLYKEGDDIEKDVKAYSEALINHNNYFESIQDDPDITTKNLFGERIINDKKLKEKLLNDDVFVNRLKDNLNEKFSSGIEYKGKTIEVDDFVDNYLEDVSIEQLKSLNLNSQLTDSLEEISKKNLESDITNIWVNHNEAVERKQQLENMKGDTRLENVDYTVIKHEKTIEVPYGGGKVGKDQFYGSISGGSLIQKINYKGEVYIVQLSEKVSNGVRGVEVVYDESGQQLTEETSGPGAIHIDPNAKEIKDNLVFREYDEKAYTNRYESPELRYYETEPYKGLPAVVPFDLNRGWYAYVSQTLPVLGNIGSYSTSGRVSSLYVCNVWENNREDNRRGDDKCTMVNLGTGQPYDQIGGVKDAAETRKLVGCAVSAVEQASRQHRSGVSRVQIRTDCGKFDIDVGEPAVDIPDVQCQDFMSPKECLWLFNICDPVICPPSRCDFGGSYPVKDVIQSGIIGSIVLCLPNFQEGIRVPVCLSGIKAGIDGLLSVYTSYRDCLQESLDTGKMVGICDEIYSIYLCEFFWRQALPIANLVIPKMMEMLMGQNVRGGGEYLGVASAWDNAGKSMDYFVQYYAAEAYTAFKARVSESISDAFCDVFISGSYPDGGNLIDSLTEPDSPPQFHGRFDEIPFTTATVPPVSHYKVFYHIYAGKESRAYYKVYLKASEGTSFYQDTSTIRFVDSGYIATGDYVSETLDFTAPSGYREMCIMVNNQEECGFKEVSTSFAVDYIKDQYKKEQAGERDIKTEKECVSGTASLYSLLTPSAEGAAEEMIDPSIYNRGIIRICATESPGKATDPSRWIRVGYCGDENMKCWLDTKSVENAMEFNISAEEVLKEQSDSYLKILMSEGNYSTKKQVDEAIKKIKATENLGDKIKLVNRILDKVFWNDQKAHLLLLRGNAYGDLARALYRSVEQKKTATPLVPDSDEDLGDYWITDEEEEPVEEEEEDCTEYPCEAATSVSKGLYVMGGKCHTDIGKRIMEVAKEIKEEENIDDEIVKRDTGAENFECLVLQLAMQESCLAHCIYKEEEKDYKYCDGNSDLVVKGDDGHSIGIMQLSDKYFDKEDTIYFEENVNEGIKHLIKFYNPNRKYYNCKGEYYSGWQRALRHYNGWPETSCSGDPNYVENVLSVLSRKAEIAKLFPECA